MTHQEFTAWLDGFINGVSGEPTAAQWALVKQKLKEVTVSSDRQPPRMAPKRQHVREA